MTLRKRRERPTVVVVGPLPPPANGMTMSTEVLLGSTVDRVVDVVHVDTSDHRDVSNVGRIDVRNITLAIAHAAKFISTIARRRPDAIYLPIARNRVGVLRDALFLAPSRLCRIPTIIHFHSWDFTSFYSSEPRWMQALVRAVIGRRSHVIVLSRGLRNAFGDLVPPERVHVVGNGVRDVGCGAPAGERKSSVLHLSTLWSEKGVFDVLEVARRLRDAETEGEVVLAGPWYVEEERVRALEFIEEHRLSSFVRLTGFLGVDERNAELRRAAVLLLASHWEGQPLVVLEALSAGTPVVGTNVGAVADTVGDAGTVVPVGDVEAMYAGVHELLVDGALRSRLGRAARARYESRFTPDVFAMEIADVFQRVMTRDRSADVVEEGAALE